MQALSPSIFPCYAPEDGTLAAALAAFLERGADVRVFLDEGCMQPGEDLAAKARQARMADIALVLFSRASLPPRWPRAQWEDALQKEPAEEGVRIGFVKCDDCVPPKVLAPQFAVAGRALDGLRRLKRWIRTGTVPTPQTACPPDIEVLGIAIADRPGAETIASAALASGFADAFRDDFDAVLRLECGDRTLAALAGDLAGQLGLRLEGDLDSNLARLGDFCAARRFLFVLEDARTPPDRRLLFGGRSSTLLSSEAVRDAVAPAESLRAIQHAFTHAGPAADWTTLCRLARIGRRLTRDAGRMAECYELMQQWRTAAQALDDWDWDVLNEATREMVWVLEGWGRTEEAQRLECRRAAEFDRQMALPFGEG